MSAPRFELFLCGSVVRSEITASWLPLTRELSRHAVTEGETPTRAKCFALWMHSFFVGADSQFAYAREVLLL
mgnify:CR=1 FL=1